MSKMALRYDPGITDAMPWGVGCFRAVPGFFCWLFSLFVTFFIICNFCNLLFTVERGKVCYFLLLFLLVVTLINYFLLFKRARVYKVFIVWRGNLKGCGLIFFIFYFLLLRGRGVEVNVFFFPRYMKRWKEEGGKGVHFFLDMFFSLWSG